MKIIRDLTHGYISINQDDLLFIDTALFQRLKRIKQITAHVVYPNATHSRFEHSIGVMHLGFKIFELINNEHLLSETINLGSTVRYACLLHDIGHAPFSHATEGFFDKDECKRKLKEYHFSFDVDTLGSAPHELMSCIVSLENFNEEFTNLEIDKELFCRMILGADYKSDLYESKYNPLISLLNSYIDVDKLDYVLRDSKMTGFYGISLDTDRIVQSYVIHNKRLVLSSKSLSVISNLIYGRNALYRWVYNHHVVTYYTTLIKRFIEYLIELDDSVKSKYFSFKAINEDHIDDHDIISLFKLHRNKDDHTKKLFDQILNRQYLKPLWKTPFEFEKILSLEQKDYIITHAKIDLENKLKSELTLTEDELYVVIAKYKPFNPGESSHICILIDDELYSFTDLFETEKESIFLKELPYIYVNNEKRDSVLHHLKEIQDNRSKD